jgi:hypothetical protein
MRKAFGRVFCIFGEEFLVIPGALFWTMWRRRRPSGGEEPEMVGSLLF